MTDEELLRHRLHVQQLSAPHFEKARDVVQWLGAVQAQDYLGSLWAIGQRTRHADEAAIEKAVADREIVRTWPMRGTLHFVDPKIVRWMLKLLTPRVTSRAASIYRQAELDTKVFLKSAKVLEKALAGSPPLARDEVYAILERAKIRTTDTRGLHILGYLAMQGLICFGPRRGKQPTFTLLDEWLPSPKQPDAEKALAKLALTYFRARGPATLDDFQWWSGLTKTEALASLSAIKTRLIQETIQGKTYWMADAPASPKLNASATYLLPPYDEYTVAYKDRSAMLDRAFAVRARNGIFSPVVVINGKIAGLWKRTFVKNEVVLEADLFKPLTRSQSDAIHGVARRYGTFVGKSLRGGAGKIIRP
jgi:hypothetical protein